MDTVDTATRSWIMSRIRSVDTGPELAVRGALHRAGYRFRKNLRGLPGTPDIVFTRRRVAVQVFGCFWHAHSCRPAKIPKSNSAFWGEKLEGNRARDRRDILRLRGLGYLVIIVWECQLKRDFGGQISRIRGLLDWGLSPSGIIS